MDVRAAVQRAHEAAKQYVVSVPGLRVEEVEQGINESSWNITLSWLEEDTAQKMRDNVDPMSRALFRKPQLHTERTYKVFEIRGDAPVRMKRAPDPR
jgi:hypothetical protein